MFECDTHFLDYFVNVKCSYNEIRVGQAFPRRTGGVGVGTVISKKRGAFFYICKIWIPSALLRKILGATPVLGEDKFWAASEDVRVSGTEPPANCDSNYYYDIMGQLQDKAQGSKQSNFSRPIIECPSNRQKQFTQLCISDR